MNEHTRRGTRYARTGGPVGDGLREELAALRRRAARSDELASRVRTDATDPPLAGALRRFASDAAFAWWWGHPERERLEQEAFDAILAGARLALAEPPRPGDEAVAPASVDALTLLRSSFPARSFHGLDRVDVGRKLHSLALYGYVLQADGSMGAADICAAGIHADRDPIEIPAR